MRILYSSRDSAYKAPFGVLREGELCRIQIDIPLDVPVVSVSLCIEDGCTAQKSEVPMRFSGLRAPYARFSCALSRPVGLYFYYFRIEKPQGGFRLFRQGSDTNMEAGDLWQVSWITAKAAVPDWARGAVYYQIFPDRFFRSGAPDLTGKLEPYSLHASWDEEPEWKPNEDGEITNSDFFGGNLRGILEKLPYLRSLGVTVLYLNPIFLAWSNHRYDTADYRKIDPLLGTEDELRLLCGEAHRLGMRVILDGVFSHTGDRSPMFQSAVSSPDSPYRSWYCFRKWPEDYLCWWDFRTLPCLDKNSPGYRAYLVSDEDSVAAHWLRVGADGWRLDVADELPDSLIAALKARIRAVKPDALLMGEVWEDASNKIAYDVRRRYFIDGELDSVMNYPLRDALLAYCTGADDGSALGETLLTLLENYPPEVLDCCMNLLSSHDTARFLTALEGGGTGSRAEQAAFTPTEAQRSAALRRFMLASVLQFTLPGSPSIYYGDEVGMEGGKDPFNRRPFPWGRENETLLRHFRALGALRQSEAALRTGKTALLASGGGRFAFRRESLYIYSNLSEVEWEIGTGVPLMALGLDLTGGFHRLSPGGCAILRRTGSE